MPVTHGVRGSSPLRTASKPERKSLEIKNRKRGSLRLPRFSFPRIAWRYGWGKEKQIRNNAHILSLLSYTDKTTGRLHLIIKIDLEDVSPVIRSFERFNYTVLYYFMEKGMVDDLLQQRMEELVRYMNI